MSEIIYAFLLSLLVLAMVVFAILFPAIFGAWAIMSITGVVLFKLIRIN